LNSHLGDEAISNSKGVVLIDEIDQHLHPRWQRRIVGDLKRVFPNIQFIATTHSPFIVQSLDIDEVISLGIQNEISPNKLSIEEIARYFMGVESVYSAESQTAENQSTKYLELLEKVDKNNFQAIENQLLEIETHISDPAMRAFLQMQKLKKQTQI
jgi:predicted ATP-binding protein involved in virulence